MLRVCVILLTEHHGKNSALLLFSIIKTVIPPQFLVTQSLWSVLPANDNRVL